VDDEPLIHREELTAALSWQSSISRRTSLRSWKFSRRTTMAKRRKLTAEERAELEAQKERSRHFRELLERRQKRDEELRAAREQRAG
jgi:hypothetical protein